MSHVGPCRHGKLKQGAALGLLVPQAVRLVLSHGALSFASSRENQDAEDIFSFIPLASSEQRVTKMNSYAADVSLTA